MKKSKWLTKGQFEKKQAKKQAKARKQARNVKRGVC